MGENNPVWQNSVKKEATEACGDDSGSSTIDWLLDCV